MNALVIDGFYGPYRWLSNFWAAPIIYNRTVYATVEHAYQAAKCTDLQEASIIENARTPTEAKKMGKNCAIRADWNLIKFGVMYDLVKLKFESHDYLREKLLATGDAELIEGNTWGDVFWGVCDGVGDNNLGKILMQVRDELKGLK
jgi:hypothetical protein